jgi:copper homeostasis protein
MNQVLEICCFNIQSTLIAQAAGAQRVEFCSSPSEGGTTQSLGAIRSARENLHIELYPIIRPRGGDFLFSAAEFEIMMGDVALCKQIGCEGVVIGLLHPDGTVDKKRCTKLIELAYPMGVTFHRAFDWSADPHQALEDIIEIGCERILTSGQKQAALDGAGLIGQLVQQAAARIIIMPGSGIRAKNILEIKEKTGAVEFHSSARIKVQSTMHFTNTDMHEDNFFVCADENEIIQMNGLLQGVYELQDAVSNDPENT